VEDKYAWKRVAEKDEKSSQRDNFVNKILSPFFGLA